MVSGAAVHDRDWQRIAALARDCVNLLSDCVAVNPFNQSDWGTIGYWEMEETSWGTPAELTSSEKADTYLRAHQAVVTPLEGQVIGSYAFLWGQKQERTPTWFGMLTEDGRETETVDVMHYIWTGSWPANRTPRVESIELDDHGACTREISIVRVCLGRSWSRGPREHPVPRRVKACASPFPGRVIRDHPVPGK